MVCLAVFVALGAAYVYGGREAMNDLKDWVEEKAQEIQHGLEELAENMRELNDKVMTNTDGSVTFIKTVETPKVVSIKRKVSVLTTPVATLTTITKLTTTSSEKVEIQTKLRSSSQVFNLFHKLWKAQVKLKSLTAFFQISVKIAFNTAISFPQSFRVFTNALSFVSLEFPNINPSVYEIAICYLFSLLIFTLTSCSPEKVLSRRQLRLHHQGLKIALDYCHPNSCFFSPQNFHIN